MKGCCKQKYWSQKKVDLSSGITGTNKVAPRSWKRKHVLCQVRARFGVCSCKGKLWFFEKIVKLINFDKCSADIVQDILLGANGYARMKHVMVTSFEVHSWTATEVERYKWNWSTLMCAFVWKARCLLLHIGATSLTSPKVAAILVFFFFVPEETFNPFELVANFFLAKKESSNWQKKKSSSLRTSWV